MEKIPEKIWTKKERKIIGFVGLLFYLVPFLIIFIAGFIIRASDTDTMHMIWLAGLTVVSWGNLFLLLSSISKIWRYIAQNTD